MSYSYEVVVNAVSVGNKKEIKGDETREVIYT